MSDPDGGWVPRERLLECERDVDRLQATLDRLVERQCVLAEMQAWAVTGTDAEALAAPAVGALTEALGVRGAAIYLQTATGEYDRLACQDDINEPMPMQMAVEDLEARTRGAVRTCGATGGPYFEYTIPVTERSALIGALVLRRQADSPLDEQELSFVYGIGTAIAMSAGLRAADRELRRLALHDALTGLPNRHLLADHLERAFARAARTGQDVAVFFIDLDGFKAVNDRLGHRAGDDLLVETARRLTQATRAGDLVARLAGDEFVVVVEAVDELRTAAVLRRLTMVFDEGFEVGGSVVSLGASVGVSVGHERLSAQDVLAAADEAMYLTKRQRSHQRQVATAP